VNNKPEPEQITKLWFWLVLSRLTDPHKALLSTSLSTYPDRKFLALAAGDGEISV
jgi:hypothetical protein